MLLLVLSLALLSSLTRADCVDEDKRWCRKLQTILPVNPKKARRRCNRKRVARDCPKTCGTCETSDPISDRKEKCPEQGSPDTDFQGSCEPGLSCPVSDGYVWKGCNSDDMFCSNNKEWFCNDNGNWELQSGSGEVCPWLQRGGNPTKEQEMYHKPCDLDKCPPNKPKANGSCSWYQGTATCFYDYQWTGCSEDDQKCSPTTEYTCNGSTWDVVVVDPAPCDDSSIPLGSCDPGYNPRSEPCPLTPPMDRSMCDINLFPNRDESECNYEYVVTGCQEWEHKCEASITATCIRGEWYVYSKEPDTCGDQTPSIHTGNACDPDNYFVCPGDKPSTGDGCMRYSWNADNCPYEYKTCESDSNARCEPTEVWRCNERREWEMISSVDLPFCPIKEEQNRNLRAKKRKRRRKQSSDDESLVVKVESVEGRDDSVLVSGEWIDCDPNGDSNIQEGSDAEKPDKGPIISGPDQEKPVEPVDDGPDREAPVKEDKPVADEEEKPDQPIVSDPDQEAPIDDGPEREVPVKEDKPVADEEEKPDKPIVSDPDQEAPIDDGPEREVPEKEDKPVADEEEKPDKDPIVSGPEQEAPPKEERPAVNEEAIMEGVCPGGEPTPNTSCKAVGQLEEPCEYGYEYSGCTMDSLECRVVTTYTCEMRNGRETWLAQVNSIEFCQKGSVPRDWPSGFCDPTIPIDQVKQGLEDSEEMIALR